MFRINACRDVTNFEHRFNCRCKSKVATNVFNSYAHFTKSSRGHAGNAAIALSYIKRPSFSGRLFDMIPQRLKQKSLVHGVTRQDWRSSKNLEKILKDQDFIIAEILYGISFAN
jgi:hypothetical protein